MLAPLVNLLRPLQFRGKARLLGPLVPGAGVRTVPIHGYTMDLDLSDHIQRMIYIGAYERWETRIVSEYLKPGMRFLDVGANVGYYTLLAARRVGPTGQVIAVEPSQWAADRLARTIAANHLTHVRLERIGLGRENAEVYLPNPGAGNHSPSMLAARGGDGTLVHVRTLDDRLAEWGEGRIDLLKMDIEGFEPAVVDGGIGALRGGRVGAILCEFNEYWLQKAGTSATALHERILGLGFRDVTGEEWAPGADLNRFFQHVSSG